MNAVLLAIEPNDLEILMLEAQTTDEVYHAQAIRSKLNLGETSQALHFLLKPEGKSPEGQTTQALEFAIQAEYPFSHPALISANVRYNPVVEVDEIEQVLQSISIGDFKRRFDPEQLNQQKIFPFHWGQDADKEQRELVQLFAQLKNFYQLAKQHNHAVISLQSKQIMSDVYYMNQVNS